MQLDKKQMDWVDRLSNKASEQESVNAREAQKAIILEKFAQERERNWETILKGMQIKVARVGENGKVEEMEVWREDLDQMKSFDIFDQDLGYRIATADGKGIEGEVTEDVKKGQAELIQPEFDKHRQAIALLTKITDEAENAKVTKNGKPTDKKLFKSEELTKELYDPLVRRGVPETFIGNEHSRTQAMMKGTFEEYAKRLEKEDVKGFVKENADLGIALLKMCVALPGNVMTSVGATQLLASQQQTATVDPKHVFQQNFGIVKNDSAAGPELGEYADNLQKAAQSWAFIQNVSDLGWDGVKEGVNTAGELSEIGKDGEEEEQGEGHSSKKLNIERTKFAPVLTQAVIACVSMNVSKALPKMGAAGATVFSSVVKRGQINALLAKKDLKAADITAVLNLLADAVTKTLETLAPDKIPTFKPAADDARKELAKVKPDDIIKALEEQKFEAAIKAFNEGAAGVGEALKKLGGLLDLQSMKAKASEFISERMKEETEESRKPQTDAEHKQQKGHNPDWVESGKTFECLECAAESKDANLFAGILDRKIAQLKKEELYFKMAVNVGGLAFDVAANFLAPLAMGGALLRMSRFIFVAVKRAIDFNNFCSSKAAMLNSASAYSPAVRRFREDSRNQGLYYSLNAACEGVKFIGATLSCTPAVIGGIIASQTASGVEAIAAVAYELNKRHDLSTAWRVYKKALNNPENRRLALVAIRNNPTLAKYAVAWGAVVAKDPLVDDFIDYCGINADTLRGNSKIDKVVEYLEARMPDDIQVVGRKVASSTADWAPSKIALTPDSWIDAKTRGETQGGVKPADTGGIEAALTTYEAARGRIEAAKTDPKTEEIKINAALKCLDQVNESFGKYVPRPEQKDGDVQDMRDVVAMFRSQVDIERKALRARIDELKQAQPLPPKAPAKKKRRAKKSKVDSNPTVAATDIPNAPAPADVVFANLGKPNPTLYFVPNSANGQNYRVDSDNPGGNWQKVEQFCAYLASYWLASGKTGGLKFSDLGATQADAVKTLVGWGSKGGLAAQVSYAQAAIGGKTATKAELLDDAKGGKLGAGTKIWFGSEVHSQAALVLPSGLFAVYDPNSGAVNNMSGSDFAAYAKSDGTFVVAAA